MLRRAVVLALGWALAAPGCSANRCPTPRGAQAPSPPAPPGSAAPVASAAPVPALPHPEPSVAAPAASASPATASSASAPTAQDASLAALGEPTADTHATRGLSGGSTRSAMAPNVSTIPSLPAKLSVPAHAGVDQTMKSLPQGIPVGHLSKDTLEGPLRDPAFLARCHRSASTRVDIDAVVYNGTAVGVTVHTTPNDRELNFCIERIVRETSWLKELAVNRVTLSL